MTTQEQNDFLTRTAPGTPMGNLIRRYWIPALLSSEIAEPDCPPVRLKLLGERLIAFRDSQGRVGIMDEFCAHRGVSLWFGRNEDNGLRCPYHGWKYDVTGQCVEVIETSGGIVSGVRRPATPGKLYWRITHWVMPFHTMIPPYGDNALNGHAFVPVDDDNCLVWCFTHHPIRPLSAPELDTMRN